MSRQSKKTAGKSPRQFSLRFDHAFGSWPVGFGQREIGQLANPLGNPAFDKSALIQRKLIIRRKSSLAL
jgi:hypothetical protein